MIKIEHLTKKFGDAVVLDDISMELVPVGWLLLSLPCQFFHVS